MKDRELRCLETSETWLEYFWCTGDLPKIVLMIVSVIGAYFGLIIAATRP